ncbi:hypothetical protein F5Y13DRAFT_185777 [Hypoxylon sp. FL1857]|nr:hypothetical protein F5Y13DRAFT_185777 [Hypoxylon sp. FL1857]
MTSCFSSKTTLSSKKSNLERAKWRTKCRQVLSEHINQKLGIEIEPPQVRLHTNTDDGYSWQVLPEKRHLFSKNLSDHSIKAYKELCEGVGATFEAIRTSPETPSIYPEQNAFTSVCPGPLSFISRINELQVQNDYLSQQFNLLKLQLEAEVKLRLSLEEKLKVAYDKSDAMQNDLQAATRRENLFRGMVLRYSQGIAKLVPIMNDLQTNPGITDEGFL